MTVCVMLFINSYNSYKFIILYEDVNCALYMCALSVSKAVFLSLCITQRLALLILALLADPKDSRYIWPCAKLSWTLWETVGLGSPN